MTLKDDLDKMRERFPVSEGGGREGGTSQSLPPYSTPVSDTNRFYVGVNDDYIDSESHATYEEAVEHAKLIVNVPGTWKVDIEEQDTNGTVVEVEVVYLDAINAKAGLYSGNKPMGAE